MPHRNRITPLGEIITTLARGLFMGNRGKLLNGLGEMVRTCLLDFKDRWHPVMTPSRAVPQPSASR